MKVEAQEQRIADAISIERSGKLYLRLQAGGARLCLAQFGLQRTILLEVEPPFFLMPLAFGFAFALVLEPLGATRKISLRLTATSPISAPPRIKPASLRLSGTMRAPAKISMMRTRKMPPAIAKQTGT